MATLELVAEDVGIEVGGVAILDGVNLVVRGGSMVAITGPPASGKSLLAQVLAGLRAPTRGQVRWRAKPMDRVEVLGRPAFMPQGHGLFEVLTAAENVELPLQVRSLGRAEVRRRAAVALEAVGLGPSSGQLASELSGGQRQRAAVARALALDAGCLVLDEPTSELDAANRDRVLELLRAHAARGAAIVVVAHDPEVLAATDNVITLGARTAAPERTPR